MEIGIMNKENIKEICRWLSAQDFADLLKSLAEWEELSSETKLFNRRDCYWGHVWP